MSDLLTAADVEGLARTRGISMAEVCRRAGIATSIFTRWKKGLTRPNYGNYQRIIAVVRADKSAPAATPTPKRRTPANTPPSQGRAA
jgi:transcriptional regulator with XRE-family HTH domain